MFRMEILICVLIIVAFVDIFYYRIPNVWIAIGMITGFALIVKDSSLWMLIKTCGQMGMVLAIFYPFYLIKGLGAGDVKLFMLLGCYLRGAVYLRCLIVAMLLAGLWAMGKLLLYQESRERLIYLGSYCKKVILTGALDPYKVDRGKKKGVIRLSVPVLCSVLLLYGGFYS